MATVTFTGNPVELAGIFPAVGDRAPAFQLVGKDLRDIDLTEFAGKRKVLNIVPSLDTPVCATSTRRFNEEVAKYEDVVVLVISADLPFAQARFCGAEGLSHVTALSTMRGAQFMTDYGVQIRTGPLAGLTARAAIVLDASDMFCMRNWFRRSHRNRTTRR